MGFFSKDKDKDEDKTKPLTGGDKRFAESLGYCDKDGWKTEKFEEDRRTGRLYSSLWDDDE